MIYSDTKAYVWPGATGKACSQRNKPHEWCVSVEVCKWVHRTDLVCVRPVVPMGVFKSMIKANAGEQ